MAFLVSPGVEIKEKDLTNIIPAVSTSTGAFAGAFEWGPAATVVTLGSEKDLTNFFGYPRKRDANNTATTYTSEGVDLPWTPRDDWYVASNFLGYSNSLKTVRVLPTGAKNAASDYTASASNRLTIELVDNGIPATVGFTDDYTFDAVQYHTAATFQFDANVSKRWDPTAAVANTYDDFAVTDAFGARTAANGSVALPNIEYLKGLAPTFSSIDSDFVRVEMRAEIQAEALEFMNNNTKRGLDAQLPTPIGTPLVLADIWDATTSTWKAFDSDGDGLAGTAEMSLYNQVLALEAAYVAEAIRNRKAVYAFEALVDLGLVTDFGSLLPGDVEAEFQLNAPIDIAAYDPNNARFINGLLLPADQINYDTDWDAAKLSTLLARVASYAAAFDQLAAIPLMQRVETAFLTAIAAETEIDATTVEAFTNPVNGRRSIRFSNVSTTGVTLAGNTAVTDNGLLIEFVAPPAGMDTDATAFTNTLIENESVFEIEKESLTDGSVYARYPGKLGNSLGVVIIDASVTTADFRDTVLFGTVRARDLFDTVPRTSQWGSVNHNAALNDEVHVVVYTKDTKITGTAHDVLETYSYLSKASNAKTADGASNYYVDAVNNKSQYVYLRNEETASTGAVSTTGLAIGAELLSRSAESFKTFVSNVTPAIAGVRKHELNGGLDGATLTDANVMAGFDLFNDVETIDISLVLTGAFSTAVKKHVIDNLCEKRKDCICVVSPSYEAAVTNPTADGIADYFNNATTGYASTSYAVFDSGWKRQYDRYNDEYFWAPLSTDVAGLMARTDYTNDPWWSPAGLNRGNIKNVVKLSFNPDQTARDTLYTQRINPVVTFRGQGTVLYGDKTALSRPSAFDRINVRRLFIVLEKAIATASKYYLFEFNDDFTRRSFINAVEPFLNNIRTRRGLTDFKVVCDESNNTGEIIDANRFVADIYIKPVRSINFITLNFVAVRTDVSFSEIVN